MADSIIIEKSHYSYPEATDLLDQLSECLFQITGSSGKASFNPENTESEGGIFVLARNAEGVAIGCGALQGLTPGVAEIKRVYSCIENSGTGKAIVDYLEQQAWEMGYMEICLETRRVNQRALNFYLKLAYTITENYGKYAGNQAAVCFKKSRPVIEVS